MFTLILFSVDVDPLPTGDVPVPIVTVASTTVGGRMNWEDQCLHHATAVCYSLASDVSLLYMGPHFNKKADAYESFSQWNGRLWYWYVKLLH